MRARPLASFLLLATLVAGCATANAVDPSATTDGTVDGMYAAGPDTQAEIDPYTASDPYASATPGGYGDYGDASPTPGPYGSASPTPSPTPTAAPVYSVPEAHGLAIAKLTTKTTGVWLWQKCTATVVVENPTRSPLSGEIQLTFTRAGGATETVNDFVEDLAPGKTHSFTVKSTKRADDAEAVVDTEAPAE